MRRLKYREVYGLVLGELYSIEDLAEAGPLSLKRIVKAIKEDCLPCYLAADRNGIVCNVISAKVYIEYLESDKGKKRIRCEERERNKPKSMTILLPNEYLIDSSMNVTVRLETDERGVIIDDKSKIGI